MLSYTHAPAYNSKNMKKNTHKDTKTNQQKYWIHNSSESETFKLDNKLNTIKF